MINISHAVAGNRTYIDVIHREDLGSRTKSLKRLNSCLGLTPVYNHKRFRSTKVYHNFIGIDISKVDFYVATHGIKKVEVFTNNEAGFQQFYQKFEQQLHNALVVLETTGSYEYNLIDLLQQKHVSVHRANTRIVKSFIRSTGKLGKFDSIDATGLARYGSERQQSLSLYKPTSSRDKELAQLANRRKELKWTLAQEKNRLQAPENKFIKDSYSTHIQYLESMISQIEKQIQVLIKADDTLHKKVELLKTEIDGVGEITAINLVVALPELGKVNGKAIASLSGVAPHPYESGKMIGYRRTRGGREGIKPILYMSAMAASQSKGKLGEFYRMLIAKGKKPIVALVALMRKIVVMANAKIRELELANCVPTGL